MEPLETPSRILRRMEALEAQDHDLPSLPSLPAFEDSLANTMRSELAQPLSPTVEDNEGSDESDVPYQSTPAPPSFHAGRQAMFPPLSKSSSATRFENSMRTSNTARKSRISAEETFEISQILPMRHSSDSSAPSIPDVHFPAETVSQDFESIQDNVDGVVRLQTNHPTSGDKYYDYSVSLRSEPKASPINPLRHVSIRKPLPRTRTPSLSRTTPSPTSTSPDLSPKSPTLAVPHEASSLNPDVKLEIAQSPQHDQVIIPEFESDQDAETSHIMSVQQEEVSLQDVAREETRFQRGVQDSSFEHIKSLDGEAQPSESPGARPPLPVALLSSPSPGTSAATPVVPQRSAGLPVEATPMPGRIPSDKDGEEFATPYNRRRSFLLSLVQSSARPRMAFPTPHPIARGATTPRPRPHPLSQAWNSPAYFTPQAGSDHGSGSSSSHDRLSFISTASSHDLTVHPRANASFDPLTGAKGVGRFDAGKLNTYLHGLNRRLQEENEILVRRLRMHGEEVEMGKIAEHLERESFKNVEEAAMQEIDSIRDELDQCMQRNAAVVEENDALCRELENMRGDYARITSDLQNEKEERKKDKERWKDRMVEVENGVEVVIKQLELKLEEAEQEAKSKDETERKFHKLEEKCCAIQEELATVHLRAEKAENALARSSDLGLEIIQANENLEIYREEARDANERANSFELRLRNAGQELTDVKMSLEDQIAEVNADLQHSLETQQNLMKINTSLENRLAEADADLRHSLEAQQSAVAHALELGAELDAAERCIGELRVELDAAERRIGELEEQLAAAHEASLGTPIPQRPGISYKSPKTPGPPMKDFTWLHGNTISNASPLVAQIESLKKELNLANDSIDAKVDKLEEAGVDIVGLTQKLEDARCQIVCLEDEVRRLQERDGRLRRTQVDMDGIKIQLEEMKRRNGDLEAELRVTAEIDQRAQLLETTVSENRQIIEQLRHEKESMVASHASLQQRYVHASAQVDRLRQELAASHKLHDERRHQLDMHVSEIEKLRQGLAQQARHLEHVGLERNKAQSDRGDVVTIVASLECDLRRVQDDVEVLGRDLDGLKDERNKLERKYRDELGRGDRAHKQLSEQVEAQRAKATKAAADLNNHACQPDLQMIEKLRIRHKDECKGLMVQIRYLKDKFTRESLFRSALVYQKHYLLNILASYEKSEEHILVALARIGVPPQPKCVKRRTLRAFAVAVLFIVKARASSEIWKGQSASRPAVIAALQEVRLRRVAGSLGNVI